MTKKPYALTIKFSRNPQGVLFKIKKVELTWPLFRPKANSEKLSVFSRSFVGKIIFKVMKMMLYQFSLFSQIKMFFRRLMQFFFSMSLQCKKSRNSKANPTHHFILSVKVRPFDLVPTEVEWLMWRAALRFMSKRCDLRFAKDYITKSC